MSAGSVMGGTASFREAGGGSIPTPALQRLVVKPAQISIAKQLIVDCHYLHSLPGGTKLAFVVSVGMRIMGALTLGAGPLNAYCLVEGSSSVDCLVLTRLWVSDLLPKNSESRILGVVLRSLRKNTDLKFLVSYADPAHGHVGTIYQATGWAYTGLSQATPLYDLGDGRARHSRSLSHAYGTHGLAYFKSHGINVNLVPQQAKHRYIYFLDPSWRSRVKPPVLAYPKGK